MGDMNIFYLCLLSLQSLVVQSLHGGPLARPAPSDLVVPRDPLHLDHKGGGTHSLSLILLLLCPQRTEATNFTLPPLPFGPLGPSNPGCPNCPGGPKEMRQGRRSWQLVGDLCVEETASTNCAQSHLAGREIHHHLQKSNSEALRSFLSIARC